MNKLMNLASSLLLIVSLSGVSTLASAEGKIAVFNAQAAVLNTEAARQKLKTLEKNSEFAKNKTEAEGLQKELKGLYEALRKDGAVMSDDKKLAQQKKIGEKRADMEHLAKKLQAAQKEVVQSLLMEMQGKTREILQDIVKTENIGLLLDSQVAIHADASFDITAKVTERLNQGK